MDSVLGQLFYLFLVCFFVRHKSIRLLLEFDPTYLLYPFFLFVCFLGNNNWCVFLFMVRLTFNSLFFNFSNLVFKYNKRGCMPKYLFQQKQTVKVFQYMYVLTVSSCNLIRIFLFAFHFRVFLGVNMVSAIELCVRVFPTPL